MNLQTYNFEIRDLIAHFVNAFDGAIINRYTKERAVGDSLAVRYVYAPKQRILHDLVNKAKHITLPCVALVITDIQRDPSRVFNKIYGSHMPFSETHAGHLPQPVPVNINISMSVIARYTQDMDQIISNWAPYSDPYITLSWMREGLDNQEIRSTVHWSGNLSLGYPVDINNQQPARVTCDTTFVIKGWLFKHDSAPIGYIYNINTPFQAVKKIEDPDTMNAQRNSDNTDYREVVGRPHITFLEPYLTTIDAENEFKLFGEMLDYTTSVYASANNVFTQETSSFDPFGGTSLSAEYVPFEGLPITFEVRSENMITFTLPPLANTGKVDIIVVNPAGYGVMTLDTYNATSTYQYPFSTGIQVL